MENLLSYDDFLNEISDELVKRAAGKSKATRMAKYISTGTDRDMLRHTAAGLTSIHGKKGLAFAARSRN